MRSVLPQGFCGSLALRGMVFRPGAGVSGFGEVVRLSRLPFGQSEGGGNDLVHVAVPVLAEASAEDDVPLPVRQFAALLAEPWFPMLLTG